MLLKNSGEDYDLRGSFQSGATPAEKRTMAWLRGKKPLSNPNVQRQSMYAK